MYKIIGGDQKEYGPSSAEELRRWIAEGRLSDRSLVQAEGSGEWKPLGQYPEFADVLAAQVRHDLEPGAPVTAAGFQGWINGLLARPARLDVGGCLARGARLMAANFLPFLLAAVVVWILGFLALLPAYFSVKSPPGAMPDIAQIAGTLFSWACNLFGWVLGGVLQGGMFLLVLKRLRGQPAGVGEVFSGFRAGFLQLVLVGVVSTFLSALAVCALCVGWVYLTVAWSLCVPVVADKRIEFWTAMEVSRRVVSRVWFEMLVLMVCAFAPYILVYLCVQGEVTVAAFPAMHDITGGSQPDMTKMMEVMAKEVTHVYPHLLLSHVVLLLNLPFVYCVLACAYEDLFGPRPATET